MHRVFNFVAATSVVALISLPAAAAQSPTDQSGSQPGAQPGSTAGTSGTSAQETSGGSHASHGPGATDHAFATKAAEGGLAEVKLGQLAAEKASSDDVKKFGQMMVDDHSKANDQLKEVAQKKNITMPQTLNAHDQATYDRLSKLSGGEFDRAYMKDMVSDHQKDVKEFKRAASSVADADLKQFASSTLPTLQKHLQDARHVAAQVGATTATTGTKGKDGSTGTSGSKSPANTPTTPPRR
jgi:putative membrane protein